MDPALVYPRVPHGPWTYEPHAQGRTLSYTFFYLGLGISFAFTSGFACFFYFGLGTYLFRLQFWFCLLPLHLSWYSFCLHFGFLHSPSALVLISHVCLHFGECLLLPVLSWSLFQRPFRHVKASLRGVGESIASFPCFG